MTTHTPAHSHPHTPPPALSLNVECPYCGMELPGFMYQRHLKTCAMYVSSESAWDRWQALVSAPNDPDGLRTGEAR